MEYIITPILIVLFFLFLFLICKGPIHQWGNDMELKTLNKSDTYMGMFVLVRNHLDEPLRLRRFIQRSFNACPQRYYCFEVDDQTQQLESWSQCYPYEGNEEFVLEKYAPVLVRDNIYHVWNLAFFCDMEEFAISGKQFYCWVQGDSFDNSTVFYNQCIPYKGNESLLGKATNTRGQFIEDEYIKKTYADLLAESFTKEPDLPKLSILMDGRGFNLEWVVSNKPLFSDKEITFGTLLEEPKSNHYNKNIFKKENDMDYPEICMHRNTKVMYGIERPSTENYIGLVCLKQGGDFGNLYTVSESCFEEEYMIISPVPTEESMYNDVKLQKLLNKIVKRISKLNKIYSSQT